MRVKLPTASVIGSEKNFLPPSHSGEAAESLVDFLLGLESANPQSELAAATANSRRN